MLDADPSQAAGSVPKHNRGHPPIFITDYQTGRTYVDCVDWKLTRTHPGGLKSSNSSTEDHTIGWTR